GLVRVESVVDRRTPHCLRAGHGWDAVAAYQPEVEQLADRLPVADELAAAADRDDDLVRELPAELFRRLERERLGALRVERADVDVAERPRRRLDQLAAEAVDLVVVAADGHQVGLERRNAGDLGRLQVDGDEDEVLQAGAGRGGGDRVGEGAGGCAWDRLEAMRGRLAYR